MRSKKLHALWWLVFALLVGWLGYLLFGHLGDYFIVDYDEARHGVNAYEMIRNENFIVHTYQGETDLWNLKPPLSFWSIALDYQLFGYNALGLRFHSALSMLVAAVCLALWARKHCGMGAALVCLLAIIGNAGIFGNHFARFGDADTQYQMFFTLSMLCMLQSPKSFRWFYGSALCFALAFLDKGTHALIIPLVCLLYLVLTRQLSVLTWKRVLALAAVGLLPIAAWAAARVSQDGLTFFEAMFSTDVAGRLGSAAAPSDASKPALLYYLNGIFRRHAMKACGIMCLLCALVLLLRRKKPSETQLRIMIGCTLWLVVPVAVFSMLNTKYVWYVYSAYAAFPALMAVLLSAAYQAMDHAWRKAGIACTAVLSAALIGWGGMQTAQIAEIDFHHSLQQFLRDTLDRDLNADQPIYIEYAEGSDEWMQADVLTVCLYGDGVCKNGGADAFFADEEYAVIYLAKEGHEDLINTLYESYLYQDESYYWICFTN